MRFAIFPVHLSTVLRLPRKSDAKSYEVLHLSRKIISKPEDLMLQNATPLRKSAPWPPNISDEHVFCIAPATRNASLKILFKCPTPAIAFGNATKPSRFAHFWQGAQSLAPATRKHIWTSKSAPYPSVFFALLTSKCASRHKSVHFFHISTSKSGPELLCFVHFDFKMCFVPQRRVLFRHLNFQKWSGVDVFCTFWLRNVLRATTACTFSTSQLPKVVQTWCFLYILTCKFASRHKGVQFFISHLARWLRTRRFSEPTFRPSGATIGKTQCFATFLPFRASASSFFWLSLLWSALFYSSLLSTSAHLCFSSVHIVGSFISKLPSIRCKNIDQQPQKQQCEKKGSRRDRNFRRGFPGECEMRGGGDL